jgi:hypothetical protein
MSAKPPAAYVSHTTLARVRFRVPSKRHDAGYFGKVKAALGKHADVAGVKVTPRTGSILVFHASSAEKVAKEAEKAGLFVVSAEALEDAEVHPFSGLPQDLQHMMPPLLVLLGLVQVLRGRIAGPASTMLVMALSMALADRRHTTRGDWFES